MKHTDESKKVMERIERAYSEGWRDREQRDKTASPHEDYEEDYRNSYTKQVIDKLGE